MIQINKTHVVRNKEHYGKYVVPMFLESGGNYMCKFTGKYAELKGVSFKPEDLITIEEWRKLNDKRAS